MRSTASLCTDEEGWTDPLDPMGDVVEGAVDAGPDGYAERVDADTDLAPRVRWLLSSSSANRESCLETVGRAKRN